MRNTLWVGIGGGIGAIARYHLGRVVMRRLAADAFPLGTLWVNVLGCLIAGVLTGWAVRRGDFAPETRLFLFAGLLGGFTTFSAFGVETVSLLQRRALGSAGLNVVASVGFGLLALWLGMRAAS
jgi:CrcB protein